MKLNRLSINVHKEHNGRGHPVFATAINQSNQRSCPLCSGLHCLDECKLFLTKPLCDKKAYVIEKRLCFACLAGRHTSKSCKNRLNCRNCWRQHSTSLHGDVHPGPKKDRSVTTGNSRSNPPRSTVIEHSSIVGAAVREWGEQPV